LIVLSARARVADDLLKEIKELEGRVAALKAELAEVEPEPEPEPEPPQDPERRLAEQMLRHLNRSRTPWLGGDDDAA
jgi:hypothetical protein